MLEEPTCDVLSKVLETAVARHPQNIAIRHEGGTIRYSELDALTARLAAHLSAPAAGKASRVIAIFGHRSPALVISVLATTRAGFTFAILDASYPPDRVRTQAAIIAPALIVAVDRSEEDVTECFGALAPIQMLTLEQICALPESANNAPADPPINAYLLFTSGTTGVPKCIQTGHAPLLHFLEFYRRQFQPSPTDRFSMLSGIGHDPFLRDLFAPLAAGAAICIPRESIIRNPRELYAWIQDQRITFAHATPQLLKLLAAGNASRPPLARLRYVFSGGDTLRPSHVTAVRGIAPNASMVNFYGATETPQAMGFHVVTALDEAGPIPIGRGIDEVDILILDADLKPVPQGERGQIAIRTRFLSNGYLNDAEATTRSYRQSPLSADSGAPTYLTGDVGYRRGDGAVVSEGRGDDQVKVRGFRVELNEVTHAIEKTRKVSGAVVLAQRAEDGENRLLAWVVPSPDLSTGNLAFYDELKSDLTQMLPGYMLPSHYLVIDAIPLSPNGKVDRAKLLAMAPPLSSVAPDEAHSGGTTLDTLAAKWRRILSVPSIEVSRSFVDLGGDSLSYIQASLAIEQTLGWLPPDWEKIPLAELARMPRRAAAMRRLATPILIRAISIVLIVATHIGMLEVEGATTALFIAAGWSFGKYQLRAILQRDSVSPLIALLSKIVFTVTTVTLLFQIKNRSLVWQSLLLLDNYIPPSLRYGHVWFVEVLVQIFALLAIAYSFRFMRAASARNPFLSAVAFAGGAIVLGFGSELIWNTNHLYHRVPQYYLWTVFAGVAAAYAGSLREKIILSALIAAETLLGTVSVFALVATSLIIWIRTVSLPASLATPVQYLAIGSLFIYLTHFFFISLTRHIGLANYHVPVLLIALAGGIALNEVWEQLLFWMKTRLYMGGVRPGTAT